ncbi:hypothetical protein M231_07508 [Tremella mesenterica]|uniref:Uncharacterized protein n=1 Tax=Tremella mesenterica TaxID=5217 RepID=A0A4V1M309_TREME|nr:hypothetical protein M231_07508 [Tremella mesenterica]
MLGDPYSKERAYACLCSVLDDWWQTGEPAAVVFTDLDDGVEKAICMDGQLSIHPRNQAIAAISNRRGEGQNNNFHIKTGFVCEATSSPDLTLVILSATLNLTSHQQYLAGEKTKAALLDKSRSMHKEVSMTFGNLDKYGSPACLLVKNLILYCADPSDVSTNVRGVWEVQNEGSKLMSLSRSFPDGLPMYTSEESKLGTVVKEILLDQWTNTGEEVTMKCGNSDDDTCIALCVTNWRFCVAYPEDVPASMQLSKHKLPETLSLSHNFPGGLPVYNSGMCRRQSAGVGAY